MYLAQNLKYLREKNGETQKDISKMLSVTGYGFSEMSVSRYESGECEGKRAPGSLQRHS